MEEKPTYRGLCLLVLANCYFLNLYTVVMFDTSSMYQFQIKMITKHYGNRNF